MRLIGSFVKQYLPAFVVTYTFLFGTGYIVLGGFGWFVVVAAWVTAGICLSFFVISWVYGALTSRLILPPWAPFVLAWTPGVVVGAWFAWWALGSPRPTPPPMAGSYARELLLLSIGFGVHGSALLFCTRKRRQQTRRRRLGLCVDCGYDVTGLTGTRCPECGATVGHDHAPRRLSLRMVLGGAGLLLLAVCPSIIHVGILSLLRGSWVDVALRQINVVSVSYYAVLSAGTAYVCWIVSRRVVETRELDRARKPVNLGVTMALWAINACLVLAFNHMALPALDLSTRGRIAAAVERSPAPDLGRSRT